MLRIARYRTWDELQELKPLWNGLLSRSHTDTVFLTWQWCSAWWANYAAGRELFVLAAWDGKELTGIAPLYREDVRLYGRIWSRLRLIGDGSHDSDYLDFFAECGREIEVMPTFARYLDQQCESWDWIELNGPLQDSPSSGEFIRCVRESNWKFTTETIRCASLPLPRSWEKYLRILAPRFRTTVRSALALLNTSLKSAPKTCATEDEIANWLPVLFDLHTRRWESENLPGVFGDLAKRAFYHDLSRSALEQGWLALHRLDWAERPLALQYGLVYKNRFHLLQEGYDPSFASIRPGVALRAWLMRHWIESGLEEYDFLAGAGPHKLAWGAHEKLSMRLLIAAKRPAVMVALDLPEWRARSREAIGRATPELVLSMRKRALTRSAGKRLRESNQDTLLTPKPGITRRLVARTYSSTLLGSLGRSFATNYYSKRSGFGSIAARRRDPVLHIFQYHRVNDDHDPFLGGLPVETFRAQMQYLARHFTVVSLNQLVDKDVPERQRYSVAITFDDGYRDNCVCAFPILKQFGIPATIFLATGYIGSEQLPWYDQVRLAFKLTTRSQFSLADLNGPNGRLDNVSDRLRFLEQTLGWLRGLQEFECKPAIAELFRTLGLPSELNLSNQMLHWDDIRQMTKHRVTFGAHTVTHPVLSKIPASHLRGEIEGSKRVIENKLQLPVSHFAYPFGQTRDFNAEAKRAVKDAGFRTAATTIWGLNQTNDDLLELKRFTPWETDLAEFRLRLDWFRFREPRTAERRNSEPATPVSLALEARV
jgi:peptidoglycan/xylan/chitin deacetylase (PgdA/CDA1 family)/CelD/BcsL family acetyltransferase involved in cellulose biosynthesis